VTAREELAQRCETVEQAYEFMLAYAAQGLGGDAGSQSGGQLRELLSRAAAALNGLSAQYATLVEHERPQARDKFAAFLQVLGRDAAMRWPPSSSSSRSRRSARRSSTISTHPFTFARCLRICFSSTRS